MSDRSTTYFYKDGERERRDATRPKEDLLLEYEWEQNDGAAFLRDARTWHTFRFNRTPPEAVRKVLLPIFLQHYGDTRIADFIWRAVIQAEGQKAPVMPETLKLVTESEVLRG